MDAVTAFAPATVSNVACGFDVLGFALHSPGDEVTARLAPGGGVRIDEIVGDHGRLPRDAANLDERVRGTRSLRSPQRKELFDLLQQPLESEEIESTAPVVGHPVGDAKRAINELRSVIDLLATQLDLPPGLLCSRRSMEEYVMTGAWPEALEGWRRGVLHERLAGLLPR